MKLRAYMDEKDISDETLAAATGLSVFGVRKLRYGERRPSLGVAMKIEAFTRGRVKPSDFLSPVQSAEPTPVAANPDAAKDAA